jgi:tRNA(adenine34) deaminase
MDEWLKKAYELAKKAKELDEVPIGALLVLEGKLIGSGHNLKESQFDPTAHAEILAIRNATQSMKAWRLEGATLYVTLEPCPMCLAACQQARISKVIYGAKDLKGGAISLGYLLHEDERTNHRFEVEFQESEDCSKILSDFFKNKRLLVKGSL